MSPFDSKATVSACAGESVVASTPAISTLAPFRTQKVGQLPPVQLRLEREGTLVRSKQVCVRTLQPLLVLGSYRYTEIGFGKLTDPQAGWASPVAEALTLV